jgi:hypothetical protein
MKAITLWQPWASYVAHGMKKLETRSWPTSYRGPLAIHAAARQINHDGRELMKRHRPLVPFAHATRRLAAVITRNLVPSRHRDFAGMVPFGAIVAVCRLVDVFPIVGPPGDPREHELGDFTPGRFAWVLLDVEPLKVPVPARGRQGLWEWNPQPCDRCDPSFTCFDGRA